MKVDALMTREVEPCTPFTSLAAAVEVMWRRDCGVVPVVDAEQRVIGVITDRDIAIALGTRDGAACAIGVGDVMTRPARTCRVDDELPTAIAVMKAGRVRRLPVIDARGRLAGILSVHDLARAAGSPALSHADLAGLLQSIGQSRPTTTGPLVVSA